MTSVTSYQPSIQTVCADWTHLFGTYLADSYEAFLMPIDLLLDSDVFSEILHEGINLEPARATAITCHFHVINSSRISLKAGGRKHE